MCTSYSVVFRFSPDSLTWLVSRGPTALSRHCRKRDAVREAARLARASGHAELTVERVDGSVQCVRRYGRTIPAVRGGGDGRASADGDSVAG